MDNKNYSIAEEFRLPSNGEFYTPNIDPQIRLRSMTTLHEKKLTSLANNDAPLKVLSEIIDDCTVEKKGISSYDMIYGDFEFLIHKLRVVTFGPTYTAVSKCPVCGLFHETEINLDDVKPFQFNSSEIEKELDVRLPLTQKVVKMRLMTARMRDDIAVRAKEVKRKNPRLEGDLTITLALEALIDKVDNQSLNPAELTRFVETLPMKDGRVLSSASRKIKIGLDTSIPGRCPFCEHDYKDGVSLSGEFFNPTLD